MGIYNVLKQWLLIWYWGEDDASSLKMLLNCYSWAAAFENSKCLKSKIQKSETCLKSKLLWVRISDTSMWLKTKLWVCISVISQKCLNSEPQSSDFRHILKKICLKTTLWVWVWISDNVWNPNYLETERSLNV